MYRFDCNVFKLAIKGGILKIQKSKMFFLIIFIIGSSCISQAKEQWLCTEESSQIRNGIILACGVGGGSDENEARAAAFENSKAEFKRVCLSSDTCSNHEISVEPKRTSCEGKENSYKCYRLVAFIIGRLIRREKSYDEADRSGSSRAKKIATKFKGGDIRDKREIFLAFNYESTSDLPRIYRGMEKKELFALFGAPASVWQPGSWSFQFVDAMRFSFKGSMCEEDGFCTVTLQRDKVWEWTSFKPIYTEDLK